MVCVRLFCVPEKDVFMKNRTFMLKSREEKRRYITKILRNVSHNALDAGMINGILKNVSIHRQYRICTFSNIQSFQSAVTQTKNRGAIIRSQHRNEPIAAVITPSRLSESKQRRAIYIYMPDLRIRKGWKNE